MPQKFYELVTDNCFHLSPFGLFEYHDLPFFTAKWQHAHVDAWTRRHLAELIEHQGYDIWFQHNKDGETDSTYFGGNLTTLVGTDFPVVWDSQVMVGSQFFIVSKHLLAVLRSVGDFTHTAIPITIYDGTEKYPFLADGTLAEHIPRNTDYVRIVDLPKIPMNREMSRFSMHKTSQDNKQLYFYELSLEEPEDGLPPIFQVRESSEMVFVTKETAIAMKAQGVAYVRLYDYNMRDYYDIKYWEADKDEYQYDSDNEHLPEKRKKRRR